MAPAGLWLGPSFDRVASLREGHFARLRWIRASDAALLREGFARLSDESRYMRFFAPIQTLSDAAVQYLTDVDGDNHAALVALSVPAPGGLERGLGVARFVRAKNDPSTAEFAVTVVDDSQRLGLGTLLTVTLGAAAHARGVETFTMNVLWSNRTALRLLRKIRAERRARDGDVSIYSTSTALLASRARERWGTIAQPALAADFGLSSS